MKVHFICGYYSDLAHNQIQKRPEPYWDAYFYVWGVKIGTFRRPFNIRTAKKVIPVEAKNFKIARQMFGSFVAQQVSTDWGDDIDLMPIPSKDGVAGIADFRTSKMMTEAMAETKFKDRVTSDLTWSEALQKAHQGGSRRREFLKDHLQISTEVAGRKIVLVDDLLSTGGSLLAAQDFLELNGATVVGAVTCGRTIYDFETKPFGRQQIELNEELADFGKANGEDVG
ncbi:phosphoribosyltransferase [Tardiphaga sp. 604_B6_N1_1]|uniref:phosphoribosyltransferase n=1 Tax=Tardiphaga sp. 604_B6_N1_1 TaxID=3240779 RepID=UPI003F2964FB